MYRGCNETRQPDSYFYLGDGQRPPPDGHATTARWSLAKCRRKTETSRCETGKSDEKSGKPDEKVRALPKDIHKTDIASVPRLWNAGNVQ